MSSLLHEAERNAGDPPGRAISASATHPKASTAVTTPNQQVTHLHPESIAGIFLSLHSGCDGILW